MRWADILRALLSAPLFRSAQRTFVSALTLHLVPLYFALDALRYHALPALALHLKAL